MSRSCGLLVVLLAAGILTAQPSAVSPDPNTRRPYFQGLILATREPDLALAKLERTVELCGDEPQVPRLRLAELLLAQDCLEEAGQHFRHVLDLHPGHARAELGLGRLAFRLGQWDESLRHLQQAKGGPYSHKAALTLLAQVHERRGDPNAGDLQRQAVDLPNDAPWPDPFLEEAARLKTGKKLLLMRANGLLKVDHPAEAVAVLRQAVREYPDSDTCWLMLGRALTRQRNLPAAEDALATALRLTPDSVEALFRLGVVLQLQGKSKDAVPLFRRAAELKPDSATTHYNLGLCLSDQGDNAGAAEALRAALKCKADYANAHSQLGALLHKQGRRDEALEHLRTAIHLNPTDDRARKLLEGPAKN